jgi:hypothetical protein
LRAAALLPGGVRALAAVHTAGAQIIGAPLEVLVTYDESMLEVVRSIGIPAEAPGFA